MISALINWVTTQPQNVISNSSIMTQIEKWKCLSNHAMSPIPGLLIVGHSWASCVSNGKSLSYGIKWLKQFWWKVTITCKNRKNICTGRNPQSHQKSKFVSQIILWCNKIFIYQNNENTSRFCNAECLQALIRHGKDRYSMETQKMSSHCELAVSPRWVCNSHRDLDVSYSWDQLMSSPYSGNSELPVISLLTSRWDIQVSPLWVWR